MFARGLYTAAILAIPLHSGPVAVRPPTVLQNPNTEPAGTLRNGVLRIEIEARLGMWHPDGDSLPGIAVEAFAERGKRPQAPGPLIRVPVGSEIRAKVRNSLARDTLTVHLFSPVAGDSLVIPPGKTGELRVRTATPGTFLYSGRTGTPLDRKLRIGGLLAGAVVVDSLGGPPARDRIFVLQSASDSADPVLAFPIPERSVHVINGRSWPHTERLRLTVGDTARWRVINAGNDVHPLHLHGFYFRVDALDGPRVAAQGQGPPGRMVVTERLSSFATMSLTWIPVRPGNWLFHCHLQRHVVPHGKLDLVLPNGERQRIAPPAEEAPRSDHANHAAAGMAQLAVGVEVLPRPGERERETEASRRRLRLVATRDPGFADSVALMRYLPESAEPAGRAGGPAISPTLYLTRGEPVAITVVNRLPEPTAIHWHGIELESYFDGVPGFSGAGSRLAPIIAPGDSFEARFTPPRAGTFIYHSHVDELRQHRVGLVGGLIVQDAAATAPGEDLLFFIKSARQGSGFRDPVPLEINGYTNPDTVVLSVRRAYRLRLIGMQTRFPNATVSLTARPDSSSANLRDTLIVRWRPVAKDGADLPAAAGTPRTARQIVSMGETYDFEFVPERRANLRLEVRTAGPEGRLLVRAPIRVE